MASLAAKLESEEVVGLGARETNQILKGPSKEIVGIPLVKAVLTNIRVDGYIVDRDC